MGYPFYYWPNQLMMNKGDGTFRDRAASLGIEPPTGASTRKRISGVSGCPKLAERRVATSTAMADSNIVTNNFQ